MRSLISVFDKLSLEITITYTFNIEISRFLLVSVAEKAFLILTSSEVTKRLYGYANSGFPERLYPNQSARLETT